MTPLRVISGGQTGADRAALEAARDLGLPHGGFVPQGRLAEDGPIDPIWPMQETDSPRLAVRTAANVAAADATLLMTHGAPTGGSALTLRLAQASGKPWLHLDLAAMAPEAAAAALRAWRASNAIATLNIAGPRASKDPMIHAAVHALLLRALGPPPG